MADQIKHGSTEIVNSTAKVVDGAMPTLHNSGVSNTYVSNTTQRISTITVDGKGRITAIANAVGKASGIDFKASGNTLSDVTVFVSTSAPGSGDGADGDVWYQVTS